MNDYIIKAIEIKNKNVVVLSKTSILFYCNKSLFISKENENLPLYDYEKYSDIKQTNNIKNISLLEFNDNFIIVISGNIKNLITDRYFLTFINVTYNINKKIFEIEYSINELFGTILYSSVCEDNNILIKLSNDILGIGGKYIYLYSLKYNEIFQIIDIPSNNYTNLYFPLSTVSSFFLTNNQIIYVAVKYFNNISNLNDCEIKFYIYCFLENNDLNDLKELSFLTEAKPISQQNFFDAAEI